MPPPIHKSPAGNRNEASWYDFNTVTQHSKKRKRPSEDVGLTLIPPINRAAMVVTASTGGTKRRRTRKPTIQYSILPGRSLSTIHTPPSTPKRSLLKSAQDRRQSPFPQVSSQLRQAVWSPKQDLFPHSEEPTLQRPQHSNPDGLYTFAKTPEPLASFRWASPQPIQPQLPERMQPEHPLHDHRSTINAYHPAIVSQLAPPLNLDGNVSCTECQSEDKPVLCCDDCLDDRLYCSSCIVERHRNCPFHRVFEWMNGMKVPTSLSKHGLTLILGHANGNRCPSRSGTKMMQVLHSNGLHEVKIYRCECFFEEDSLRNVQQFLANRLFPATSSNPSTLYTFEVLKLADRLQLDGYIAIKQFCDSMVRITPNRNPEVCLRRTLIRRHIADMTKGIRNTSHQLPPCTTTLEVA